MAEEGQQDIIQKNSTPERRRMVAGVKRSVERARTICAWPTEIGS